MTLNLLFSDPCPELNTTVIQDLIKSNATFSSNTQTSGDDQIIDVICSLDGYKMEGPREFTCGLHQTWQADNCSFNSSVSNCPVPPMCIYCKFSLQRGSNPARNKAIIWEGRGKLCVFKTHKRMYPCSIAQSINCGWTGQ